MSLIDDREEDTAVDLLHEVLDSVNAHIMFQGNVPQVKITEETTTERCMVCGRKPGVVVASQEDRFESGMKHALERLKDLMQKRGGVPRDEAEAIVARLSASDVELP